MPTTILKLTATAIALLLLFFLTACNSDAESTRDIPAVKKLDLPRYMGKWYEIARLHHAFERNVTDAMAEYTLLTDGTVKVVNSGLRFRKPVSVTGVACPTAVPGELKVSFFRPFYGLYKIIYLNKDYTLAIVTSSTRDYVWIMARKPVISRAELAEALALLHRWNFEVNLLQYPSGMVLNLTEPHP